MTAHLDLRRISEVSVTRSMILLASGAFIGLCIAGWGLFTAKGTRSRGVPAEAVALVNQRSILRSDFMVQAQTEFTLPFAQVSRPQRQKVLEDMINEELMMQRGLEIDLPSYDPEVRNALVAGVELEVTAQVLAQQPTADELQVFYRAHQDQYSSEGVMRLRDLVLRPKAGVAPQEDMSAATAAAQALRAGQSVDSVGQRFGMTDSGRFLDAGHVDLGDIYQFAVHAKVDAALERSILQLNSGEVSDPVAQSDGLHVIVMIQHRLPIAQSFDEASNRVWSDVKSAARNEVRAANLDYLRNRADILIAPDALQ